MLKCAQLDLARQKEPLAYVREIIDFLKENGYNALHLYVEDRIRTRSYPYAAKEDSYTPAEIRSLVRYASERGIEVFPCVGTLGHAERFLSHPELSHLAELQGNMRGRFGGTAKSVFCPSNPKVPEFLGKYLKEVSALFPSTYFHAGLDEFWDFVLCERCRKAAPDHASEGRLFLEYVKGIHAILAGLGKRMVMWTDMIEFYPEILREIPRDVIMADWQYQPDVRNLRDHFNSSRATSLAKYEELGFDVWMCPADRFYSNAVSTLKYAAQFPCVKGIMLTSWEKSDTYLYRTLPIFAGFGRAMGGEQPDAAFDEGARSLFPKADAAALAALRLIADRLMPRHYGSSSHDSIFTRGFITLPYTDLDTFELCHIVISRMRDDYAPESLAGRILADMEATLLECIRSCEMNICAADIIDYGPTKQRLDSFRKMARSYMAIYRERERQWETLRPGIPNVHTARLDRVQTQLDAHVKALEEGRFLRIRLAHVDWYGLNGLKLSLRVKGEWIPVWSGVTKPRKLDETQVFESYLPLKERRLLKADAIRIEAYGYGGSGAVYACLVDKGSVVRFPQAVLSVSGEVSHPEYLLDDDSKTAWLGSQDMTHTYRHKELFDTGTAVELAF